MGNLFAQYFGLTELTSIESKCVRTGYQMFTLQIWPRRLEVANQTEKNAACYATQERIHCLLYGREKRK